MTMTVALSESDVSKVRVGQTATVSLDALTGVQLAAHVVSISTLGTTSSGVVSYNAVLDPSDSLELHFRDTIEGGAYLNDQDLAWTLVRRAPEIIRELEQKAGCYFDRSPDGSIHQKAFAGQAFDRTVHRADLTGIEIISKLRDRLFAMPVQVLEEQRALELLLGPGGEVAGAVLLDLRSGF